MFAAKNLFLVGANLPTGQQAYTTPGSYSWTAPAGVTSVCVVCVGGGGAGFYNTSTDYAGGCGGGLGWKNNIAVIPGNSYTVVVGSATGASSFISTGTVLGGAGGNGASGTAGIGGTYTGDGGGNGGDGATYAFIPSPFPSLAGGGGGGAGGYSGNGGSAASNGGNAGSGGGSGGGPDYGYNGNDGGGVGILGQGSSGANVDGYPSGIPPYAGNPGSGGTGKTYGGGQGAATSGGAGTGAVRIIWGIGRAFPSTNTADL